MTKTVLDRPRPGAQASDDRSWVLIRDFTVAAMLSAGGDPVAYQTRSREGVVQ